MGGKSDLTTRDPAAIRSCRARRRPGSGL